MDEARWDDGVRVALEAMNRVSKPSHHPSRTLVERLIADERTWKVFVTTGDWEPLVTSVFTWDGLLVDFALGGKWIERLPISAGSSMQLYHLLSSVGTLWL
mgnify:CR=1 FL=1